MGSAGQRGTTKKRNEQKRASDLSCAGQRASSKRKSARKFYSTKYLCNFSKNGGTPERFILKWGYTGKFYVKMGYANGESLRNTDLVN